tara:strand:+ start:1819 stop:4590 length:2772 start_codon:yes stop_codon:yes gene_type:complete
MKNNNKGGLTTFCGGRVTGDCIERAKRSDDKSIRLKAAFAESMGIAGGRKKAQAGLHADPKVAAQLAELEGMNVPAEGADANAAATSETAAAPPTGVQQVAGDVVGGVTDAVTAAPTGDVNEGRTSNKQIAGAAGGAALQAGLKHANKGPLAAGVAAVGAGAMALIKQKKIQKEQKEAKLTESADLMANTATARNAQLENSVVGPNTGFSSGAGANSYLPGQAGSNYVAKYGVAKKVKGGKKIDIGFGNYKFQGNEHGESGNGSSSGIVDGSTTTTELPGGEEVTQEIEVENGEVEVNYTPRERRKLNRKERREGRGRKRNEEGSEDNNDSAETSENADDKVKNKKESFILSNYLKADNSQHTISQAYLKELLAATSKGAADNLAEKYVDMNERAQYEDKNLEALASGSNMVQAMLGIRKKYLEGTPEGREATQAEIDAAYQVLASDENETRTLKEIISDTVNAPIRESNKLKETENAAKQAQYDEELAAFDAEEARVATQKSDWEEKGKSVMDRPANQAEGRKDVYGGVDDAGVKSFFEENSKYYDFGDVMKDGKYDDKAASKWLENKENREAFRDKYTGSEDSERVTGNIDAAGVEGSDLFGVQYSGARLRDANKKPIAPGEPDPLDPEQEVNVKDISLCPNGDPCPDGDCSKCPKESKKPKMRASGALLPIVPALMQKKVNPKMVGISLNKSIQTGRENRNQERSSLNRNAAATKKDITAGLSGPAAIAAKMNVDANTAAGEAELTRGESQANMNRSGQEKGINAKIAADNNAIFNRSEEVNKAAINDSKYFNENSDRAKNELIANSIRDRREQQLDFDQDIFNSKATQVDGEFDRALDKSFADNNNTAGWARGRGRNKDAASTTPGAAQAAKNQANSDTASSEEEERKRKIDAINATKTARKGSYISKRRIRRKRKTIK